MEQMNIQVGPVQYYSGNGKQEWFPWDNFTSWDKFFIFL